MNDRDKLTTLQRAVEHARTARRIYNALEYGNGYREALDNLMAELIVSLEFEIDDLEGEE
jgi:hypothetical protein